jgi:hypothetical protein
LVLVASASVATPFWVEIALGEGLESVRTVKHTEPTAATQATDPSRLRATAAPSVGRTVHVRSCELSCHEPVALRSNTRALTEFGSPPDEPGMPTSSRVPEPAKLRAKYVPSGAGPGFTVGQHWKLALKLHALPSTLVKICTTGVV